MLIDNEVVRKDLSQHLKLGPGGIREIEFVVQLVPQLIRGGREPSLRENGLLPALAACERISALSSASAKVLRESYRYLRRIENRVQMAACATNRRTICAQRRARSRTDGSHTRFLRLE